MIEHEKEIQRLCAKLQAENAARMPEKGIPMYETYYKMKERNEELESLFQLQWRRTLTAQGHWQKETGNEHWADLGRLVEWLMDKAGLEYDEEDANGTR